MASAALIGISSTLTACGQNFQPSTADFAQQATSVVGCKASFTDTFYDELYKYPLKGQPFPSAREVERAFDESLRVGRLKDLPEVERVRIRERLTELYDLLASKTVATLASDSNDNEAVLEALAAMEMGDSTTPEREQMQKSIHEKLLELDAIATAAGAPPCPSTDKAPPGANVSLPPDVTDGASAMEPGMAPAKQSLLTNWKATRHPAVFGGLKSLANAYQSCDAGLVPALGSQTRNVEGISIIGEHSNGVGLKRTVSNLDALLRSHPYLANYRQPASSCFAVLRNPLIYDYGGKPSTATGDSATLNFFKNAGSGTSVLGIDCSGYVYSALATAGLKLKRDGKLKAIGVHGVNARMYMEPQRNGLTCIDHAKFTRDASVRPGDLLASTGHIVMVESVGSDPLGINTITRIEDCRASNMSVRRLNFTILHSSPSKGGVGINRMKASDYLAGGGSMATAMLDHAAAACRARLSGTTVTAKSSRASLVRHLGTTACQDTPIRLDREECLASCPAPTTAQR